jgi:hypothetical protein
MRGDLAGIARLRMMGTKIDSVEHAAILGEQRFEPTLAARL